MVLPARLYNYARRPGTALSLSPFQGERECTTEVCLMKIALFAAAPLATRAGAMTRVRFIFGLLVFSCLSPALAQSKWERMDYGPFLSSSVTMPDATNG